MALAPIGSRRAGSLRSMATNCRRMQIEEEYILIPTLFARSLPCMVRQFGKQAVSEQSVISPKPFNTSSSGSERYEHCR